MNASMSPGRLALFFFIILSLIHLLHSTGPALAASESGLAEQTIQAIQSSHIGEMGLTGELRQTGDNGLTGRQEKTGRDAAPDLQLCGVYGNFETGRPSCIFIKLQNNATPSQDASSDGQGISEGKDELGYEREAARSITAELESIDDRVKILSGPQMAGLLPAGKTVTVQFMAVAEDAPLGVYPMALYLNYSHLSGISPSQEDGLQNYVFRYEELSKELSISANVVQGPRIMLEETDGEILIGCESNLRLILANRGDEPAEQIQMQARPSPPFLMVENGIDESSLAPEESAAFGVSVFTDKNITSGYYALPCSISYQYGGENGQNNKRQREELVALVYVGEGEDRGSAWLHLGEAGLALLLFAAGLLGLRWLMGKSRRLRIIRN